LIGQTVNYAKSVVRDLASEDFSGRGYVNDGLYKSAEYISSEFRKFGLLPFYGDSYYQQFKIDVNTFPATMSVKVNGKQLNPGYDFIVHPASCGLVGEFSVLTIPQSVLSDKEQLIAFLLNTEHDVLYVDMNMRDESSSVDINAVNDNIRYLLFSREVSAKAILLNTDKKLTWSVARFQNAKLVIELSTASKISEVKKVQFNVVNKFQRDYLCNNIVGIIRGCEKPDSLLAITAHYDHLGMMGEKVFFLGANDNASGVAMLLSLAKYYSINPPKYSILFVALAGEEAGLLGAKAFVADPPVKLNKIRFLINFDLAGTGDDGIMVVNGSVFKNEFKAMDGINNEFKLLPNIRARAEACISDHCPFYQKGIPSFYTYTMGGIAAYHDIYDRYETLPFTEFTDYFQLMRLFFDYLQN